MRIFQRVITICLIVASLSAVATEYMPDIAKSKVIVFINGKKYYVHTVKSGDTLYSMSKAYGVSEDAIKECNPTVADGLKLDQTVKIPVADNATADAREVKKRKKEFVEHKIRGGETLYSIARDYNISVNTIREDNPGLNPQSLSIGQSLWVRKSDMGSSSEKEAQAEMDAYADNLNKATDDGFEYYVVKPGETVYSLARRFEITEQEFAANNDIAGGLKAGAVIRIPIKDEENVNQMEKKADVPESELIAAQSSDENIIFRALPSDQTLNIALMLPFNVESKPNSSYVEFYQGFLLGLEKMKQEGRGESKLTVYNTEHNPVKVQNIVKSPAFEGTNLIIGPVYEDELSPVLQYARANSTPVVSPLADIKTVKSPAIYQLSPDPAKKYDKIGDLIDGGRDIYLIYADSFDKEFEGEVLALLKDKPYAAYTYSFNQKSIFTPRNSAARQIEVMDDILKEEKPCLFVVLANKETDVDRILGTISSSKVAITEKSEKSAPYVVLGTSRWGRFNNIDHTTYFNNNVVMISTYHAKRDSQVVREFDSRYIEAYNSLPSLYAYRGYDAAVIFCTGMRSDIDYNMLDKKYTPLQTSYQFSHKGEGDKYVNQEWMRVNYNSNYTITIE
ncbi:MAG: LysM peptidoglycan-binding domain-containing protein [Alistipes sp.]|nr:LysM peptidoglycan-binding domain-containing protein [Alistipes sp.]